VLDIPSSSFKSALVRLPTLPTASLGCATALADTCSKHSVSGSVISILLHTCSELSLSCQIVHADSEESSSQMNKLLCSEHVLPANSGYSWCYFSGDYDDTTAQKRLHVCAPGARGLLSWALDASTFVGVDAGFAATTLAVRSLTGHFFFSACTTPADVRTTP
jgi:hypothetical protein